MHTARISAVEVIASSDKWIKMVNFKHGNEMGKTLSPFGLNEDGSFCVVISDIVTLHFANGLLSQPKSLSFLMPNLTILSHE